MKGSAAWHLKRITQSVASSRPADLARQWSSISLTGACGGRNSAMKGSGATSWLPGTKLAQANSLPWRLHKTVAAVRNCSPLEDEWNSEEESNEL
jgi:hypothetical protein